MYLHIWRARNETAVEMLTCRESGWKIHENSLFHSWNFFCKSEIIIKRKNKTKGWGARSQPDPYRAEAQDSPLHATGSSFLRLECDSCGGFVGKQVQQVKGQARAVRHMASIWEYELLLSCTTQARHIPHAWKPHEYTSWVQVGFSGSLIYTL